MSDSGQDTPSQYQVLALPALKDNYIWCIVDTGARSLIVVDPGVTDPVLSFMQAHRLALRAILITHHHPDHVGGASRLKSLTGCAVYAPASEHSMFREFDIGCQEGDLIEFPGLTFQVLEVPGHTLDHIAYFVSPNRCSAQHIPWLFCGDTLFSAGCGRISNGTPEQLHRSLCRLAALPEPTALFCTHEYTLDNIEFALEFMPENTDLLAYREQCRRLRADSLPTLPSSIGCERRINPFFNLDRPDLVSVLARCDGLAPSDDAVQTFTRLRRQRDLFNHRLSQRHRGTSPEDGR